MTGRADAGGATLDDAALLDRFNLLEALSYSDGEQYSIRERCPSVANPAACGPRDTGRRVPSLAASGYAKRADFLAWSQGAGYRSVYLTDGQPWWMQGTTRNEYGILDVDRSGSEDASETLGYDRDGDAYLSDDERDEDADGLSNHDETHGRMRPAYWTACYVLEAAYPLPYGGTDATDADSDGDGIRDGADDEDHDDVPNLMELSRIAASPEDDRHPTKGGCTPATGLPTELHHSSTYGRVNPFNPCLPLGDPSISRTCKRARDLANAPAPFDGSPNWYALQ